MEIDPNQDTHFSADYGDYAKTPEAQKLFQKYQSQEEFNKGAIAAQGLLGKPKEFPKSSEGMTDEQVANTRAAIRSFHGVPEDIEGYADIDFAKGLPEGTPTDEALVAGMKEFGLAHDLSPDQVSASVEQWNTVVAKAQEDFIQKRTEAQENCDTVLKEKWGEEYKPKKEHIELALMDKLGIESYEDPAWLDFKKELYMSGGGNNPVIMEVLSAGADALEREGTIGPATTTTGTKINSADQEELDAIKAKYPQEQWNTHTPSRLKYLLTS